MFVTRYEDDEQFPMGPYPVERGHDHGLAKYIEQDRNIVDRDIVLWCVSGFVHAPSQEEYPVMPQESVKYRFKPHNFFNRNPTLDLNLEASAVKECEC